MIEISMRRIGLKLVFGAAVTLLLVSSVRQQWNSSKQKFARQETPSSTQTPTNVEDGFEEPKDVGANLQTDDNAERIDASVEDTSLETKSRSENNDINDISYKNQSAVSNIQKEEFNKESAKQGEDQVPEYTRNISMSMDTNESIDNSQIPSPLNVSTPGDFGNQVDIISQDAEEADAEIPSYDNTDQVPNWRSVKYADVLYDDEEEDENNSNNDQLHLNYNDFTENEVSEKSVLSWLGLGKYFSVDDKRGGANNEGILESSQDSIGSEGDLLNDKAIEMSNLDSESSSLTGKEDNGTGASINVTYRKIYNAINKDTNDTSNFDGLQVEANKLQATPTSNELPFGVNGIDIANYDDFDDADDVGKYPIQTKEFQNSNSLEHSDGSYQSDAINGAPDLETGIFNGRNGVSFVEEKQNEIRSNDHLRKPGEIDSSDFHKSEETQNDQQRAQSLFYERQQPPLPSNLLQRQPSPEGRIPPRILDLILSNNFELTHSQQFLAKLHYYLRQAIHRTDQDVDPDSNSKTRNMIFRQAYNVAPPNKSNILLSQMTAMGEFNNDKTEPEENIPSRETNNNDIYEDNYGNNGTFYDTIHTNIDDDEISDNREYMDEQPGVYTSPPEPTMYDNPRPLSDSDFALYRTQPYNSTFSPTKSVSDRPADAEVTENHSETSNSVLAQHQINKLGTTTEDESLPCPREPHLAKTTHPITALVSFSDSSTPWVRNILEQLTGIETDSIYNIMGQLKSGNAESVYHMGRKIAIETHMASVKNFDRAVVVIRNPFAVDVHHRIFRPSSIDWQKSVLWNHTYSTWLNSSLPLHVLTFEDLVESPLTELMKLTNFLSTPDVTISYKCAMKLALDPPSIISNVKEITGIYHDDRRRINQNIDYVIQVALKKYPDIVLRLNSYKVLSGT